MKPRDSQLATPTRPAEEPRRLRITVLAGGPSAEREISLQSGAAIADALRRRGHDVHLADIGPDDLTAVEHPADVIFPALHGTFGEDGTLQRILEQRGVPFVGTGSCASALAMDKVACKRIVAAAGMPTPAFEVWDTTTLAQRAAAELPLPVIVKPVDQGSSVATTIVRTTDAFLPAVQLAVGRFGRALVESLITGDELTVGFVGADALPPICIRPKRTFYDYEAKYLDNATEYSFDAGYTPGFLGELQALSRRVFDAVGCRHLARIDWMVDAAQRPWFLEVNTLPGFTSHSLVPKAAAHVGVPFDELVERLVRMPLRNSACPA